MNDYYVQWSRFEEVNGPYTKELLEREMEEKLRSGDMTLQDVRKATLFLAQRVDFDVELQPEVTVKT